MSNKYFIILILLSTIGLNRVFGQDNQEWKNYQIFQVNAEYPHASFMSCKTQEEALKYPYLPASGYQLLSGNWRFKWSRNPAERPVDFFQKKYNTSNWKTIPVPSDWQLHGYDEAYTPTLAIHSLLYFRQCLKCLTRLDLINVHSFLILNFRANG